MAGRRRVRDGRPHTIRRIDRIARILRDQDLVFVLRRRDEKSRQAAAGRSDMKELRAARRRHLTDHHEREVAELSDVLRDTGHPRMVQDVHARRLVVVRVVVSRRLDVLSASRVPSRREICILDRIGVCRIERRRHARDLRRSRQRHHAIDRLVIGYRSVLTRHANVHARRAVRHCHRAFAELLTCLGKYHVILYALGQLRLRIVSKRTNRLVYRRDNKLLKPFGEKDFAKCWDCNIRRKIQGKFRKRRLSKIKNTLIIKCAKNHSRKRIIYKLKRRFLSRMKSRLSRGSNPINGSSTRCYRDGSCPSYNLRNRSACIEIKSPIQNKSAHRSPRLTC